jgi:alpha-beta hydrolase superfamily lysophospholipase
MKTIELQMPVTRSAVAFVRGWLPTRRKIVGAIQIVHGMAEHSGRYERLARTLTDAGFAVYAQDLPGHGRTARARDELGQVPEGGFWRLALQSVRCLQRDLGDWHPGVPAFLFGHSMGSFLLQDYLSRHARDLSGAVISASTANAGPMRLLGLGILRLEAMRIGAEEASSIADLLTFRSYNWRFRPNRTEFDWLSTVAVEVDRYVADPHCGFRCSTALWIELLEALGRLDDRRATRVSKKLPLLLTAGEDDPVSSGAKGPQALARRYREAGLTDVTVKTYAGARHEAHNDHCAEQFARDLVGWLSQHVAVPAGDSSAA